MAKKVSKRRVWTTAHVRTLKSLARKKKHAASIVRAGRGLPSSSSPSSRFFAHIATVVEPLSFRSYPVALQLRTLQTMAEIATEKNSTIIFPAQFMTTAQEAIAMLNKDSASK